MLLLARALQIFGLRHGAASRASPTRRRAEPPSSVVEAPPIQSKAARPPAQRPAECRESPPSATEARLSRRRGALPSRPARQGRPASRVRAAAIGADAAEATPAEPPSAVREAPAEPAEPLASAWRDAAERL